jgi:hypothetical protein
LGGQQNTYVNDQYGFSLILPAGFTNLREGNEDPTSSLYLTADSISSRDKDTSIVVIVMAASKDSSYEHEGQIVEMNNWKGYMQEMGDAGYSHAGIVIPLKDQTRGLLIVRTQTGPASPVNESASSLLGKVLSTLYLK